jgi:hypothetical protein
MATLEKECAIAGTVYRQLDDRLILEPHRFPRYYREDLPSVEDLPVYGASDANG